MANLWPKKWSRSLEKSEQWSLTREFLKQYFVTEKQNGYLQSGRLWEMVAYKKCSRASREFTVNAWSLL